MDTEEKNIENGVIAESKVAPVKHKILKRILIIANIVISALLVVAILWSYNEYSIQLSLAQIYENKYEISEQSLASLQMDYDELNDQCADYQLNYKWLSSCFEYATGMSMEKYTKLEKLADKNDLAGATFKLVDYEGKSVILIEGNYDKSIDNTSSNSQLQNAYNLVTASGIESDYIVIRDVDITDFDDNDEYCGLYTYIDVKKIKYTVYLGQKIVTDKE